MNYLPLIQATEPLIVNAIEMDVKRVQGIFDNLFPEEQKQLIDACKFILDKCENMYLIKEGCE
ncbi:MAG: hypothetical protein DRQ78_08265 [Epsilonproteobacteria bacterium]|nr:MAG: hypothetical protein DRQ78_08265 [Campylobacterota bacterium]